MRAESIREGRAKVTEEVKRAVSRLVEEERDWENKKKHPSRWYRAETARILKLDENSNPSLRSYEELVREIKSNARIQNPDDKAWNSALISSESADPDLVPWIINAQHHRKQFLSKPLTIREIKWFARLFGFRRYFKPLAEFKDDPDRCFFFLTNVLATWAQIYAEREKVDQIAGIQGSDYSDLDIAIIDSDFTAIREYSDEKLSDQAHELLGKRKQLTQSQKEKIQEGWTLPSLKHNILFLESRILHHSLGDPDLPPHRLRTYHIMLFGADYGRYEEDYGPTYQARLDVFMHIRKLVLEMTDEESTLYNSVSPEYDMWWEDLWGTKPRRRFLQKLEVSK